MKTYKFNIHVYWTVSSSITIEATNLKEAMKLAHDAPLPDPKNQEYSDGSFECYDPEVQEEINADVLDQIKLDSIPDKDLPLYIHEKWRSEEGTKIYAERLKEGVKI